MKKPSLLARRLTKQLPYVHPDKISEIAMIANRTARLYGTSWATEVEFRDIPEPKVVMFDGYHAESRTGIRASMAALKRFWNTYHYVGMKCKVAMPLIK